MKIFYISILSLILSPLYASELKSQKIKQTICQKLSTNYLYQVEKAFCLKNANFEIKNTKKIKFDTKAYTIEMDVHVEIKKSLYFTKVFRDFSSYPFNLGPWQATVIDFIFSDYHLIKKASIHDANISEIKLESERKALPKKVLAFKGDRGYVNFSDYIDRFTYYLILNEKNESIGYIAYQWFESEEADIKGYTFQNFDLEGKAIGEIGYESFNYYE